MNILFGQHGGELLAAVWLTVSLTAVGFAGALVLGAILATCRVGPIPPLRWAGALFVEIFRNVPLFSLLILVVYGLPEAGINLGRRGSVIACMICVGAAFACETIRTGINAVGKGQVEAARAIGLPFRGIVTEVVLPQAIRTVIGPMVTLFIGILLSSALAGVVGEPELTATASAINNKHALGLLTFGVAAVIYATISLGAGGLGAWMEKRWRVVR